MKTCTQCGRENPDEAARCGECGAADFAVAPPPAAARWDKVAVLEHEVEAERLAVELNNRGIPHLLQSYYDSALDGLYQSAGGWGNVQAPGEYREAILCVLKDIREARSEPGPADVPEGSDAP